MNKIETLPLCASPSNLAYMLARGWTLLILEGRGKKVKVTIHMHENKLVNTKETKPSGASSNLPDILAIVRAWPLLILEVRGQGHN